MFTAPMLPHPSKVSYHMLLRVFLQFYPPHMVQKSEEVWILGKNANSINAESGSTWRYYILYSNSQF